MLKFASTTDAVQYLSDYIGKRVLIAAPVLSKLLPKLSEKYKIDEAKILELASADPTYKGKPEIDQAKSIEAIIQFYNHDKNLDLEKTKKAIKEFNALRGNGKIKQDTKLPSSLDKLEEMLNQKDDLVLHSGDKFAELHQVDSEGQYRLFLIDDEDEWNDACPFVKYASRHPWCVKEEEHFNEYKPMYLFTKGNDFYALLAGGQFHTAKPEQPPVSIEEFRPIKDLAFRNNLKKEIFNSDAKDLNREFNDLQKAIDDKDKAMAKKALDDGAKLGFSYLTEAVNKEDINAIKFILDIGGNFNYVQLDSAIRSKNKEIIKMIIDTEYKPILINLDHAIETNDKEIVEMILSKGLKSSPVALNLAKRSGSKEILEMVQNAYKKASLKFANTTDAVQYLSDYINAKVLIAASLKDLMPKLKDRIKQKSHKKMEDEEIEEVILGLAKGDPKWRGNIDQNAKLINIFVEWYIKNPESMSLDKMDMVAEHVKDFNTMLGQGRTDKKLTDFDSVKDFLDFTFELKEQEAKAQDENVKAKFLAQPAYSSGEYKAYEIDESWEELGRALFEEQTKWCVNGERNYDNYKPLVLFTQNDHYYALYSPSEKMFNDNKNQEITPEIFEELESILDKMELKEKVMQEIEGISDKYREPPYEDQTEYEDTAWENWIGSGVVKALEKEYDDEIEEYREKYGDDSIFDIDEGKDLYELFQNKAHEEEIDWDWEQEYDGSWGISIDYGRVVSEISWNDLKSILLDGIHKKIYENDTEIDLSKYSKKELDQLREDYPEYFKQIAESKGQTKMFSSVNSALQYLSDYTGKKIVIASKTTPNKDGKYIPPIAAQKSAQKVIKWKEKYPNEVKAMTKTGWTRARQLANREPISLDIVKRMARFYRHKSNSEINPKYKSTPWKDNGWVSWEGWGGDVGINWARKIVEGLKNE